MIFHESKCPSKSLRLPRPLGQRSTKYNIQKWQIKILKNAGRIGMKLNLVQNEESFCPFPDSSPNVFGKSFAIKMKMAAVTT